MTPAVARDFRKILSARFLMELAATMQAVVMGWLIYQLTHDPLYLGFLGLSEAIPALGLALYAGYVVDRGRPLMIYRWMIVGSFISALLLFLSQYFSAHLSPSLQVGALFAASFTAGVARGFSQPSIYATIPRLIPRDELSKATAWTTSSMQVARIAGPAMGGILFAIMGAQLTAFLLCAVILMALLSIFAVKANLEALPRSKKIVPIKDELLSGLRFVFSHSILLPALSLDMLSVLFGGVTALLPIYASDILQVGPEGLGWLRAAPAIGATLISLSLTRKSFGAGAGKILLAAVAGFGICILVFALSQSFALSLLALGLSGALDGISMVIRGSAVQLSSPDNMRGRISAVNSIFIGSSNELGEFESGIAARLLGTVPAVIFGGVMCLLTVVLVWFKAPALRGLDLYELAKKAES